jgi:peptide deformylase
MRSVTIRPIVRLGDPVLRTEARAVEPARLGSAELSLLIADLFATMRAADGVGLAAPQVGEPDQVFVYEIPGEEDGETVSRVVVNPAVESLAGELVEDWEGCLSIPELRGLVPRHPVVRVRGFDQRGAAVDFVASGFEARVIQHEYDHLHGVVFLDRMRDFHSLGYGAELAALESPATDRGARLSEEDQEAQPSL